MFSLLKQQRMVNPNIKDLMTYGKYSNKYEMKKIIKNMNISNLHISKVLGTYNNFNEIDISQLPEKFVIKVSHWSGDTRVIYSHSDFIKRYSDLKQYFDNIMRRVYSNGKEPHYKYIKPYLFIEEWIDIEPIEYKIHCIHGEPANIICVKVNQASTIYNLSWTRENASIMSHRSLGNIPKPIYLDNIIDISRKLSKRFDYVRVDLFISDNAIYFGELTFTPAACKEIFSPIQYSNKLLNLYMKNAGNQMKSSSHLRLQFT